MAFIQYSAKINLQKHDYKNHCDDEYGDDYIG